MNERKPIRMEDVRTMDFPFQRTADEDLIFAINGRGGAIGFTARELVELWEASGYPIPRERPGAFPPRDYA